MTHQLNHIRIPIDVTKADAGCYKILEIINIVCFTQTKWPSGLRRTIQVRVFIGVGSNPTFVTTPLSFFLFIPCIYLSIVGALML
jgi:hypothetical protein